MLTRHAFLPAAFTLACTLATPHADDLPRYLLHPGDQLLYHSDRTDHHTDDGSWSQRHTDWKIDVLSQNKDGSWHVAAFLDAGGTVHEKNGSSIPYERLLEASACDIHPDGTITGNDDQVVALSRLFPRLPADTTQLHSGWDDQTDDHARMLHFTLDPAQSSDRLSFTSAVTGGISGVFEPGARYTYRFNPKLNLVDQIEIHSADKSYTSEGKTTLATNHPLDPQLLAKVTALAAASDSAMAAYETAVAANPADATDAQAEAKKAGKAFLAGMLVDGGAPYGPTNIAIDHAAVPMYPDPPSEKDFLHTPAPDWTLKDLQGREHSLKDYRGKVLLLDFGSRGCPWCIREIPQLIRLSKDFQNQPVAIIDMDFDADRPADAQFVMDNFHMPYPLLLATEDLYKSYPCEGTPTVVIIDQTGTMRRRFIGYGNTGYIEMKSTIQSLLPPASAQAQ